MSGLKPQRRAPGEAQRSRQTQARSSSSSSSFSRSRCPLYREPTYLSFSDIVGTSYNRSQPVLLLILSAWKWNSPKFVCRILHSPSPTPLESPPPGTRHPRGFPGADLCMLRWMGILGSADRGRRRDHRGSPVLPVPVGGGLCKSG